jgi:gamma-glutamylcyclotransferase (GGCT)/AIG2-like uncharacterized protein YtfP
VREDTPLFVYGTLCFEEVLRALLGRVPRGEPGSVAGWRAAALARRPYPGLVPAPGGAARGRLLFGLTSGECGVLDSFEGCEYVMRGVALADGRGARTYVWRDAGGRDVLAEDWDPGEYAARVIAAYGSASRRA